MTDQHETLGGDTLTLPEEFALTANAGLADYLAKFKSFREAHDALIESEKGADLVAPNGFLIRMTVTTEGSLTEVIQDELRNLETGEIDRPAEQHSVPVGGIVYTYALVHGHNKAGTLSTSWRDGRWVGLAFVRTNQPNTYIVENEGVTLGLTSINEYTQRISARDQTLFGTAQPEYEATLSVD
jgi:hypothetical protein